jgi:hypothetical protein
LPLTEPAGLTLLKALLPAFLLICSVGSLEAGDGKTASAAPERTLISADFLLGGSTLLTPVATSAFKPPRNASEAFQAFSGVLKLDMGRSLNQTRVLVDSFEVANDANWSVSTLPVFSFQFTADGSAVIPAKREPQRSDHPYWEIILAPGQRWVEKNDRGWSRVALPFTLKEKNQNCTHNGMMTFLYQADGRVSRVAWQIVSETCQYLKMDFWGVTAAEYQPGPVPGSDELIAEYRGEVSNRLPVQPLQRLAEAYPVVRRGGLKAALSEDGSVYGYVINGIHYRSDCPTRYGPYPFCEYLAVPSYSLAKSMFAGLGYLLLTQRWPEFSDQTIAELVPECDVEDQRWKTVTPRHLVNMKTGLYDSTDSNEDEGAEKMQRFFMAESHMDKLNFSCLAWPRKSEPGEIAVYHTTDSYLLGVAMNNFLKRKLGSQADIYTWLHNQIFNQLDLSRLSRWTQRTYDNQSQPFTGYGLVFHPDDIVKIAAYLSDGASRDPALPESELEATLFRDHEATKAFANQGGVFAYRNGFWGKNISEAIGCDTATWIPFMSGFGGIVVAMFPNKSVFYHFSDGGNHDFNAAAITANNAINYCQES